MTGDRRLREIAESDHVECHGALWVVEEIARAKLATSKRLIKALEIWSEDTLVRLPEAELGRTINRYKKR